MGLGTGRNTGVWIFFFYQLNGSIPKTFICNNKNTNCVSPIFLNITFFFKNFLSYHQMFSDWEQNRCSNMLEMKHISDTQSTVLSSGPHWGCLLNFPIFPCGSGHHVSLYLVDSGQSREEVNCKNTLLLKTRTWFLMGQQGWLSKCLHQSISSLCSCVRILSFVCTMSPNHMLFLYGSHGWLWSSQPLSLQ